MDGLEAEAVLRTHRQEMLTRPRPRVPIVTRHNRDAIAFCLLGIGHHVAESLFNRGQGVNFAVLIDHGQLVHIITYQHRDMA